MQKPGRRPFYRQFAWAYDLIIQGPVQKRCDFWEVAVSRRGVAPGARVLDAGCGTGSYTLELARRGYAVTGLDLSPELIAAAREKATSTALPMTFEVGDILQLAPDPPYDAILCRGVLNDILEDADRRRAFRAFSRALGAGGVLVLDVREWDGTAFEKSAQPLFEKKVETASGTLRFQSQTRLDAERRRLLISERHVLEGAARPVEAAHDFVMRCWTEDELHEALVQAGFCRIMYYGDYDEQTPPGATDRLVAVASK